MSKFLFWYLVLLCLLFSCDHQEKHGGLESIYDSPQHIAEDITSGNALLIDVRSREEYNAGHLQHARNIDILSGDFTRQLNKLDRKKIVYLYCRSGERSENALDTLQLLGFRLFYNIGGFEDLKMAGFIPEW